MNRKAKTFLVWALSVVLAYLSGLMASSFAIGDRNLLVTVVAIATIVITLLWAGRNAKPMQAGLKAGYIILLAIVAVLGFVLSIKGIV